jgi:photosystem II stability/assembly factor-like uncharacterized protein
MKRGEKMKRQPWILLIAAILCAVSTAVADWQQTAGPCGGVVNSLLVNGNDILAATNSGVFCSTDNGFSGMNDYTYVNVIVSAGSNLFAGNDHSGVYFSTNNGTSWSSRKNGLPDDNAIYALLFDGADLYAGTVHDGVYRSSDNGANWNPANTGMDTFSQKFTRALAAVGSSLFAGTEGGVFKSTNKGSNWTLVNSGLTHPFVRALLPVGTDLFAGTPDGVFRSTNQGAVWTAVNNGLTQTDVYSLYMAGSSLLAGTNDGGIFVSTNGGTNWNDISNSLTLAGVTAFAVKGNTLFSATNGDAGVCRSENKGLTWTASNAGLTAAWVKTLAVSGAYGFAGITDMGGVYASVDGGLHWAAMNNNLAGPRRSVYALLPAGAGLLAATGDGVCFFNGTGWSQATESSPPPGGMHSYTFGLVQHGTEIFACGKGGIQRTTNNGVDWTQQHNGITVSDIRAIASNGSALFVGTIMGGVFRSTNDGNSWAPANAGLGDLDVWSVFPAGGSLYAGTDIGPYRSTNGGNSWSAANTGFPARVYDFVQAGNGLFAASNTGIWLSTNAGQSWRDVTDNCPFRIFLSLYVLGNMMYAGTDGGVWKRPVSEFTAVRQNEGQSTPRSFVLGQNYPNPFNPGTVIPFTVKTSGRVSMKIFDLAGKEIAVLVSNEPGPGKHSAKWDASALPGGVYICRLEADGMIQTRKLVLMK